MFDYKKGIVIVIAEEEEIKIIIRLRCKLAVLYGFRGRLGARRRPYTVNFGVTWSPSPLPINSGDSASQDAL